MKKTTTITKREMERKELRRKATSKPYRRVVLDPLSELLTEPADRAVRKHIEALREELLSLGTNVEAIRLGEKMKTLEFNRDEQFREEMLDLIHRYLWK